MIKKVAGENRSQIIVASHSEVLLNESAEDTVIAFVGKPHKMDLSRQSEVRKALDFIGFDQYYLAWQKGWVFYLEGSTDLAMLQSFARLLGDDDAGAALASPFVKYVGNNQDELRKHFFGLREAIPGLQGMALLDRSGSPERQHENGLKLLFWKKREIENYLCTKRTLQQYVRATTDEEQLGSLFYQDEHARRLAAMGKAIDEVSRAVKTLRKISAWGPDVKASDEFLVPLFEQYFAELDMPNLMRKGSFYQLVACMPVEEVDPEIGEKLGAISEVAKSSVSAFSAAGTGR